jgi:hypothetical protein
MIEEKIISLREALSSCDTNKTLIKIYTGHGYYVFFDLSVIDIEKSISVGGNIYAYLCEESANFQLVEKSISDTDIVYQRIRDDYGYSGDKSKDRTLLRMILRDNFNLEKEDRLGIFYTQNGVKIPENMHTTKTFAELVDERVTHFSALNPLILWSGGIDSTTIIASFVKHNIPFDLYIFEKWASIKNDDLYNAITAGRNVYFSDTNKFFDTIKNRVVITGDCCDQLYPSMQHSMREDVLSFKYQIKFNKGVVPEYYNTILSDEDKFKSVRDYIIESHSAVYNTGTDAAEDFYDNYLHEKLKTFPITITYGYQLKWFLKFIFKYQKNVDKVSSWDCTEAHAFFNTDDFQRWAITNLDENYRTHCASYLTYKMPNKEYSYSVLPYDGILNQHKTHL